MHNLESFDVKPLPPFDDYYHGRVNVSSRDQRRTVTLYAVGKEVLVTTYARYLYQVHIWNTSFQLIPHHMEVDHINEDRLDDRIENFQLLSPSDNRKKNNLSKGSAHYVYSCPMCGALFIKRPYDVNLESVHLCSKKCSLSFLMSSPDSEVRKYLSRHQKKNTIRVYKAFPSEEEIFCEILETHSDCFYPNNLYLNKDWLPKEVQSALNIVSFQKRVSEVYDLISSGMSQRKVAEHLGITRSAVVTAIQHFT